jgi:phosphatidylinositol glycan class B
MQWMVYMSQHPNFMRRWSLWFSLLSWRLLNALLLVRTLFVPDEYFQSVEVAKWLAGNRRSTGDGDREGYLTWEWRSEVALRSPIYPLLFYPVYRLLTWLPDNNPWSLFLSVHGPRLVQAIMAASMDWAVYRMAYRNARSKPVAQWAV